MGRRGRDKFIAGSSSRRRTVLQIEPVSPRKESEGSRELFLLSIVEHVKHFEDEII